MIDVLLRIVNNLNHAVIHAATMQSVQCFLKVYVLNLIYFCKKIIVEVVVKYGVN